MSKPFGDTGIVLMIKFNSITSRILLTYFIVVLCSIAITALAFHSIMYKDLERRAVMGLSKQSKTIAMALAIHSPELGLPQERLGQQQISLFFSGRPVESDYLITNPQKIIIYSSSDKYTVGTNFMEVLPKWGIVSPPDQAAFHIYQSGTFIAVQEHIVPKGGNIKGSVITFAEISALEALNRDIIALLFKSLVIAMAVAIPVALLLSRQIIKPINSLREYAKAIAQRRFDVRLDPKSDDELSELAQTFNEMAVQLERYDSGFRHFFQSTSHELKTPLMSIQGYAEGIRDGILTGPQAAQGLEVISRECQRLKSIVDEMINITRFQFSEGKNTLQHCNLGQILATTMESLNGYAAENAVTVTADIPVLEIISDPEQLRRLFGNILANAIRHAQTQVWVKARILPDKSVNIHIEDDGPGFTAQDLKHAFDYFYKGPQGHTGLGLSIAKIIVESQHGEISLGNRPEGGAIVEITLPFSASA